MKKAFILILCVSITTLSHAQFQTTPGTSHDTRPVVNGKTTADKSRLTGRVLAQYTDTAYIIDDSLQLQYPSGLSYNTVIDQWNYDTLTTWDYDMGTQSYTTHQRFVELFDAQHNLIQRETQSFGPGPGGWKGTDRFQYTYANGLLETATNQKFTGNLWMNQNKTTYTWNSSHQLINTLSQTVDQQTAQFKNHGRSTYSYDNNSNLTNLLYEQYNTTKQLWEYYTMHNNSYDANGNLLTDLEKYWNASLIVWESNNRKTYAYNSNKDKTEYKEEYWNNNTWENASRILYTYDNDHNNLTQTTQGWINGAYQNVRLTTLTYNNFHQALSIQERTWNDNQQTWIPENSDREERMYYEQYPDDIRQVAATTGDILLFPNPANNELNLHINFEKMQPFTVSVYDMTGKLMMKWTEAPGKVYHHNINTTGMPAGNYILKLRTGTEETSRFFCITKQ